MVGPRVPKRLQWAVQLLDISPNDEILEIGPGPGVSVSLVCEQLAGGRITAIDRSAIAIARATKRNADHVASGKAVFQHVDLADVDLLRRRSLASTSTRSSRSTSTCSGSGQLTPNCSSSRICCVPAVLCTWSMRHPARSRRAGS